MCEYERGEDKLDEDQTHVSQATRMVTPLATAVAQSFGCPCAKCAASEELDSGVAFM